MSPGVTYTDLGPMKGEILLDLLELTGKAAGLTEQGDVPWLYLLRERGYVPFALSYTY